MCKSSAPVFWVLSLSPPFMGLTQCSGCWMSLPHDTQPLRSDNLMLGPAILGVSWTTLGSDWELNQGPIQNMYPWPLCYLSVSSDYFFKIWVGITPSHAKGPCRGVESRDLLRQGEELSIWASFALWFVLPLYISPQLLPHSHCWISPYISLKTLLAFVSCSGLS